MLALARSCGFGDVDVVNLFRDGAPSLGQLERQKILLLAHRLSAPRQHLLTRAGLGKEIPYEGDSPRELQKLREGRNLDLLRHLQTRPCRVSSWKVAGKTRIKVEWPQCGAACLACRESLAMFSPQERESGRPGRHYNLPKIWGRSGALSACYYVLAETDCVQCRQEARRLPENSSYR